MNSFVSALHRNSFFFLAFAGITLLCSQPHSGFMFLLLAPPTLLYQGIRLLHDRRSPPQRTLRLTSIAIVTISALIVASAHIRLHTQSRIQANQIVEAVERFHATNRRYPANFSELESGLPEEHRRRLRLWYAAESGQPVLFYAATFVPFETWHYDFATRTWHYVPD